MPPLPEEHLELRRRLFAELERLHERFCANRTTYIVEVFGTKLNGMYRVLGFRSMALFETYMTLSSLAKVDASKVCLNTKGFNEHKTFRVSIVKHNSTRKKIVRLGSEKFRGKIQDLVSQCETTKNFVHKRLTPMKWGELIPRACLPKTPKAAQTKRAQNVRTPQVMSASVQRPRVRTRFISPLAPKSGRNTNTSPREKLTRQQNAGAPTTSGQARTPLRRNATNSPHQKQLVSPGVAGAVELAVFTPMDDDRMQVEATQLFAAQEDEVAESRQDQQQDTNVNNLFHALTLAVEFGPSQDSSFSSLGPSLQTTEPTVGSESHGGTSTSTNPVIPLLKQISAEEALQKPPTGTKKSKVTMRNGEIKHFLVSKGFEAVLHTQNKSKYQEFCEYVIPIPSRDELQNKTQAQKQSKEIERLKGFVSGIESQLSQNRFKFDDTSRRFLGGLMANHPKISSLAWEQTIPLTLYTFFVACGVKHDYNDFIRMSPCRETHEKLVSDFAADCMMLNLDSLRRAGSFHLSFDKGDSANGKRGGFFKLISWFDPRMCDANFPDGKILTMPLDADMSGDDGEEVATAVHFSVTKLNLPDDCKGSGATTDSGGAVLESVSRPLTAKGTLVEDALIGNCTLHNLNLEISVAMSKVLKAPKIVTKKGGKEGEARHVEQLMFSDYCWEHEQGRKIMEAAWKVILEYARGLNLDDLDESDELYEIVDFCQDSETNEVFVAMRKGAETRWWSLGEAACILYRTLPMRIALARNYDKSQNKTGKTREICQTFLSLVKEPELICDLALIQCYHRFYLSKHLKFFQRADPLTKKGGFGSFNVFIRCFLMRQDYDTMLKFEDSVHFAEVVKRLQNVEEKDRAEQKRKILEFFKCARMEHIKMFKRWVDPVKLAFLGGFSEMPTGRLICQRLLGLPLCFDPNKTTWDADLKQWTSGVTAMSIEDAGEDDVSTIYDDDSVFSSVVHKREINLEAFAKFVEKNIPTAQLKHPHVMKNQNIMLRIASGGDLWDQHNDRIKSFRQRILRRYGAFFSNQQASERGNKKQNQAATNQRQEANVKTRLVASSWVYDVASATVLGEKRAAFRGRKKIEETFKRLIDVDKKVQTLRKEIGAEAYEAQHKILLENLRQTFTTELVQQAKSELENVVSKKHHPSKKEQVSGVDKTPYMLNKLQYGKLHKKQPPNLELLRLELQGRKSAKLGQAFTENEKQRIAKLRIQDVKDEIKEDEMLRVPDDPYAVKFFNPLYTAFGDYKFTLAG